MRRAMMTWTVVCVALFVATVSRAALVDGDGDRFAIGLEGAEVYEAAVEAELYERDATDWLGQFEIGQSVAPASTMVSLNLKPTPPDIQAGLLEVNYVVNGSTGELTVSGTPLNYLPEVGADPISIGSPRGYDISVTFDTVTGQAIAGGLSISGDIGGGSQTLLEGSVARATVNDKLDINGDVLFEFSFDVSGGLLGPVYGSTAGVVLVASGNFGLGAFEFDVPWRSSGVNRFSNTADTTKVVPEPSVLLTSVMAMTALAVRRRRESRQVGGSRGPGDRGRRRRGGPWGWRLCEAAWRASGPG